MKKLKLASILLVALVVTGCASSDIYSGDVYSGSQAKMARQVSYGVVEHVRQVKIQADSSGAIGGLGGGVLGGIAASGIGGGVGKGIATTMGVIVGSVLGSKVEEKANQVDAVEITIHKNNGERIVVVQKADPKFVPGAKVQIVGSGASLNVGVM